MTVEKVQRFTCDECKATVETSMTTTYPPGWKRCGVCFEILPLTLLCPRCGAQNKSPKDEATKPGDDQLREIEEEG